MAKSEKQKLKLLYIIQCLMEKTDEEHAVTTQEIIDYLALQGITAERKSIYTDIDLLTDFGMDIINIVYTAVTICHYFYSFPFHALIPKGNCPFVFPMLSYYCSKSNMIQRRFIMCQNIPNDPVMLLSFVNTQLRDYFTTLDLFCENFNVDRSELEEKLKSIDYEYNAATNQFV
jgi:hypothetical protein